MFSGKKKQNDYDRLRQQMVERQVAARGVEDPDVLAAMRAVARHLFVPEELRDSAYIDGPLSIGHGQTISQPYIVAYMTEAARLKPSDRVLEIGLGSGYQAAVLAEIVKEVDSVEVVPELAERTGELLIELGYHNVFVRRGDGYEGWPEKAPFDAIIITAAPPEIPRKVLDQLKVGGRMVVPAGQINQTLCRITRSEEGFEEEELMAVRFVPMVKGRRDKSE